MKDIETITKVVNAGCIMHLDKCINELLGDEKVLKDYQLVPYQMTSNPIKIEVQTYFLILRVTDK